MIKTKLIAFFSYGFQGNVAGIFGESSHRNSRVVWQQQAEILLEWSAELYRSAER